MFCELRLCGVLGSRLAPVRYSRAYWVQTLGLKGRTRWGLRPFSPRRSDRRSD